MQHTKRYQCRHIFTDGHRCGSPCLRNEEFCYYHHTTRRPATENRRGRQTHFDLALPEDRSSIQSSIGEVLRRIARNEIDPRRAGLLLYGLQIASLNLKQTREPNRDDIPVEEIVHHPQLGNLAPQAEVGTTRQSRPSFIQELMDTLNSPPYDEVPEPLSLNQIPPSSPRFRPQQTSPGTQTARNRSSTTLMRKSSTSLSRRILPQPPGRSDVLAVWIQPEDPTCQAGTGGPEFWPSARGRRFARPRQHSPDARRAWNHLSSRRRAPAHMLPSPPAGDAGWQSSPTVSSMRIFRWRHGYCANGNSRLGTDTEAQIVRCVDVLAEATSRSGLRNRPMISRYW